MIRSAGGVVAALFLFSMAGCTPVGVVVGAGATAGNAVAEEREVSEVVDDTAIQLRINRLWLDTDPDLLAQLSTTVTEGRVLVTGTASDPEQRVTAIRLVWQVDGVREVINEIEVANSEGIVGFGRDAAITTQLRSRILFDTAVRSINYNIDTAGGVVYLMGIAQDQAEADRVIAHARQIPYVTRIVSYVRLKGDPPTEAGEGTT
ncbi:MAG: BON domain-containing protein [Inquilinaceae bacterium]